MRGTPTAGERADIGELVLVRSAPLRGQVFELTPVGRRTLGTWRPARGSPHGRFSPHDRHGIPRDRLAARL